MRNALCFLFFIFCNHLAYAQIIVSQPSLDLEVERGEVLEIHWQFDCFTGSISIELTKGATSTQTVKVLYDPTINNGHQRWWIPYDLETGQYRVKIYNTGAGENGNPTYVGYSQLFNIVSKPNESLVIGYYPTYQWGTNFHPAFLDRFTHINLSFLNPELATNTQFKTDENGDYFWSMEKTIAEIQTKISNLLNNGFSGKIFFSIGGAAASGTHLSAYRNALNNPVNRLKMVNGLLKYLHAIGQENSVSGIDLDLEYTAMNIGGYNAFLQQLADSLHYRGLGLTVAAEYKYPAGVYVPNDAGSGSTKVLGTMISDESLAKIDWLNMMSYDYVQANDLSYYKLGFSHSPMELAIRDFNYWNTIRGIDSQRLVLGIPLFGKERGGAGTEKPYRDLLCKEIPALYNHDPIYRDYDLFSINYCFYTPYGYIQNPNAVSIYQNGIYTLLEKNALVENNNLRGLMFWAMGNDIWEDENVSLISFLPKKCLAEKDLPFTYQGKINITEQAQNIQSSALITNQANVSFLGEDAIELLPGFEVTSGSVFKAEIIIPCSF